MSVRVSCRRSSANRALNTCGSATLDVAAHCSEPCGCHLMTWNRGRRSHQHLGPDEQRLPRRGASLVAGAQPPS